jgi:hypothetical protein
MSEQPWSSDVPVSMPEPLDQPGLVPMMGFVFTIDGLMHDLTRVDHDRISLPTYAPARPSQVVFDDRDVDA